ncbi:alpha-N-arabinofuranosidase [Flavobacterium beibuense F44-8]|uniref:non-reducing end alpha-L-arabinofuranosidase n=1 Tax=Flavobacterium beibuense F44-8 TaxID=1406840 RepID=A0A0A2LNI9_9FLAO|nr:alpha-L-arabinofuranosidase C-terminal domain-containing protein [Flavobacterium beibuense]KGO81494.1 alpha-N-arabinofuranosidase [Flavobacterium beibuense F44-8]
MKKHYFFYLFLFYGITGWAQNTIRFAPQNDTVIISRHIYGHFAEHLGRCIYDGIYVGESNTKIPNTNGVRNDIIAALRKLNIPNLRWPGGCFADTYHWKDGVGPKTERPEIVNMWWGGVTEDNSFGTHDFLNLCEVLGAEPYLAGNVGSGEVQELADWVQYVNFEGTSPMSNMRRDNGRDKSWNVKFWGVGNEAWGCGGNMTADYYADVYRKYATFMSNWNDKELYRIASGASGDDYNWTETLMKKIPKNLVKGLALHYYTVVDWNNKGKATNFTDEEYFNTMKASWFMNEQIEKHSEIMDKYDPKKEIALVVDEWGAWYDTDPADNKGVLYQQNTMRDAIIAGMNLNIFNNHAERVKMANLAQAVNVLQAVILTDGEKMLLTPTYHVMEMYKVHQDATLVPLEVNSANFTYKAESIPAVTASASIKDGKTHISLVNVDNKVSQTITIPTNKKYKKVSGRILTSKDMNDHNTFANPEIIKPEIFHDMKLKAEELTVKIPPFSVVVLEIE